MGDMEAKKRELEQKFSMTGLKILLIPFLPFPVSSTDIRCRIRQGHSIRYLVPERVITYIQEKGYYREENELFEKN